MKTAISIPDPIFQAAEDMAHNLGVSRSELFSKAISEYINNHRYQNVTELLNELYKTNDSTLDKDFAQMQLHSIQKEEW
tara:strand:+ start:1511 stop:1747 length:237 start_codon:yes stop_codon:yes gene_type:complete